MLILGLAVILIVLTFLIYSYIPACINKKRFKKREKTKEKIIYLTFDDGPSKYTSDLLDVLKKYNIKATFFCVAQFANQYKEIIERLKKEKHCIALHSLKHKNAMLQGIFETKRDLAESVEIMKQLGVKINYYRPPWGDSNLYLMSILKKEKIKLIFWDVMAEDWEANATKNSISKKLLERTKNGDIICLHDGRGKNEAPLKTIRALEEVIPIFLEKGYEFKTIDEYN